MLVTQTSAAGVHRPGRQVGVEGQMGAPCLVDDEGQVARVKNVRDVPQGGTTPVRGGAGDEGAARVRVAVEGLLEFLRAGWVREALLVVPSGIGPDRFDAGEDQSGDHRLVGVASHDELLARARHGEHRRLHGQGAAAGGEVRVLGVHRVRHEPLRTQQHITSRTPVVEAPGCQQVGGIDGVAEDGPGLRVGTSGLLVAGRAEGEFAALVMVPQGLEYGGLRVVHGRGLPRAGTYVRGWGGVPLSRSRPLRWLRGSPAYSG